MLYHLLQLFFFMKHGCCCWYCYVASVVSDSVWPHKWQPTRLPHPCVIRQNKCRRNDGVGKSTFCNNYGNKGSWMDVKDVDEYLIRIWMFTQHQNISQWKMCVCVCVCLCVDRNSKWCHNINNWRVMVSRSDLCCSCIFTKSLCYFKINKN